MSHEKIQKRLSRKCPECGSQLYIVLRSEVVDDVEYFKSYIECQNCFYEELYRDPGKGISKPEY